MSQAPLPDVEVEIPPRPEYVGVVRHLMGAVARLGQHSPEFVENAKLAGSEACTNAVELTGRAGADDRVDVSAYLDRKHRSMDCHRTQRQDFGWLLGMPEDLLERALATEYFVLTRWRNQEVPSGHQEDSLFAEL